MDRPDFIALTIVQKNFINCEQCVTLLRSQWALTPKPN